MKTLFFLVVIANVALFMWEYKTGAFVLDTETSEQNADSDQEQILLVRELKNIPQVLTPAPVSEQPVAETAVTDKADNPILVAEPFPAISESLEKPVLEKTATRDSNLSNAGKIVAHCYEQYALIKGDDKLIERLDDFKKTYPELAVKQIMDDAQACW